MITDSIFNEDCIAGLRKLPDNCVHSCITSPPYYGLRDYGVEGQIGLESSPQDYVNKMVKIFKEVKRVLRDDGTLWLNLGDSYCGTGNKGCYRDSKNPNGRNGQSVSVTKKLLGFKAKDLIGIPWRVAFALQADGWYLRQDIIWHKPNPMPESVVDRCTRGHEYIFLLSKKPKYYFDYKAIQEPAKGWNGSRFDDGKNLINHPDVQKRGPGNWGTVKCGLPGENINRDQSSGPLKTSETRNKRDVWTVSTKPFKEAHFATFPPDLIRPCILAGCPVGGLVLDPFMGAGTTAVVSITEGRHYLGFELNPEYIEIANRRIKDCPNYQFKLWQ